MHLFDPEKFPLRRINFVMGHWCVFKANASLRRWVSQNMVVNDVAMLLNTIIQSLNVCNVATLIHHFAVYLLYFSEMSGHSNSYWRWRLSAETSFSVLVARPTTQMFRGWFADVASGWFTSNADPRHKMGMNAGKPWFFLTNSYRISTKRSQNCDRWHLPCNYTYVFHVFPNSAFFLQRW